MSEKISGFLSKVFKKVGETMAAGIRDEIKDLRNAITEQGKKIDENEKDRIRCEILDFANSCRNGREHTKDEFLHIMALNDKYKILLKQTNDVNGVFDIEYKYISRLFEKKLNENAFLDSRSDYND